MSALFASFHAPSFDLQAPFEVAVVMPSVLRPLIADALASVFTQRFPGRIQVLVGIDRPAGSGPPDLAPIASVCADIPPHCAVQVLWPGYSTSVRHGGLCPARDGGTLRTALTHLANADAVAYLDDDNAWMPDHLYRLRASLTSQDCDYAFSLRWFAHHRTGAPLAIDLWESVGPGAGVFEERFGGFVDPNTLMIDRVRCREAVVAWTTPLPGDLKAMSADRMVFDRLRRSHRGHGTGVATCRYRLDPTDILHSSRVRRMGIDYPP